MCNDNSKIDVSFKTIEYESLRNEILEKIKSTDSFLSFTTAGVITIITYAVKEQSRHIIFAALVLIIAVSFRAVYYNLSIAKLSAYLIVFYENHININWETRNHIVNYASFNKYKNKYHFRYSEYLILSIISVFMYFVVHFTDTSSLPSFCESLLILLLLFFEIIITYLINSTTKRRKEWIEIWTKIKKYD